MSQGAPVSIASRIAPLLLAGVVALGLVAPASVAAAAPASPTATATTGKLVVQLVDVRGKVLKKKVMITWGGPGDGDAGTTNSKGSLTVTKLAPASNYTVTTASHGKYVDASKVKVKISAGKTTKVTLKLALPATISGTVKTTAGKVIPGIQVAALRGGVPVVWATTSSKGTYKLAVGTGSYKLGFNVPGDESTDLYDTKYWKNATSLATSTTVKVTQQSSKKKASARTSISATLTPQSTRTLTGTISITGATQLEVYSVDSESRYSATLTNGSFSITLPVGHYVLGTVVPHPTYGSAEYYYVSDDASATQSYEAATVIDLTGEAPGPITFALG